MSTILSAIWLACLLVVGAGIVGLATQRDDTDAVDSPRSGMYPHIDARTGCHYLSRPFGGITPRLDREGKQICDRQGAQR